MTYFCSDELAKKLEKKKIKIKEYEEEQRIMDGETQQYERETIDYDNCQCCGKKIYTPEEMEDGECKKCA